MSIDVILLQEDCLIIYNLRKHAVAKYISSQIWYEALAFIRGIKGLHKYFPRQKLSIIAHNEAPKFVCHSKKIL